MKDSTAAEGWEERERSAPPITEGSHRHRAGNCAVELLRFLADGVYFRGKESQLFDEGRSRVLQALLFTFNEMNGWADGELDAALRPFVIRLLENPRREAPLEPARLVAAANVAAGLAGIESRFSNPGEFLSYLETHHPDSFWQEVVGDVPAFCVAWFLGYHPPPAGGNTRWAQEILEAAFQVGSTEE